MESENLDPDIILNQRRKAVAHSLRRLSHAELTSIGDALFEKNPSHPWKEALDQFLRENPYGNFYHGTTHDKYQVVYCPEQDRGIWFQQGVGKGILRERGRTAMKEIIADRQI